MVVSLEENIPQARLPKRIIFLIEQIESLETRTCAKASKCIVHIDDPEKLGPLPTSHAKYGSFHTNGIQKLLKWAVSLLSNCVCLHRPAAHFYMFSLTFSYRGHGRLSGQRKLHLH